MKEISEFFGKFRNVALKELNKREVICSVIEKVVHQKIEINDIELKNGTIVIRGNQGLKSEIFLKKKTILDMFAKNNINIVDIK